MIAKNAVNIRLISVPLVFQKMIALQNDVNCERARVPEGKYHLNSIIKKS